MQPETKNVTALLVAWGDGNEQAREDLLPIVYNELRRLAAYYLGKERREHTLQPTALVHEAYMRMIGNDMPKWQGRVQFFSIASKLMRQVLVDHARSHAAAKRGGGKAKISLDEPIYPEPETGMREQNAAEFLALDEALQELSETDERKARIIELRYFGGLTYQETADVLGVSVPTVVRQERVAKAWLESFLNGESDSS